MRGYEKGIMVPIGLIIFFAFWILIAKIDAGAEHGGFPEDKKAIIQTVVILEDGNEYVVAEKVTTVTVNTYHSQDPENWDIVNY